MTPQRKPTVRWRHVDDGIGYTVWLLNGTHRCLMGGRQTNEIPQAQDDRTVAILKKEEPFRSIARNWRRTRIRTLP